MTDDCRDRPWDLMFLLIFQVLREVPVSHDRLLALVMRDLVSAKKCCGCSARLRWSGPSSRALTVCGPTGRNSGPSLQYFAPGNRSHSSETYRRKSVTMVPMRTAPACSSSPPPPRSCSSSDRSTEAPPRAATGTATGPRRPASAPVPPAAGPGRAQARRRPALSRGQRGVR